MASIAPIVASYFKLFKNLDKVTKELKLSYFTIKTTYNFRVIYYLDCNGGLKRRFSWLYHGCFQYAVLLPN